MVLYDDIDRFIECRAAMATLRHGERRSIRHLRAKLIVAGVVHQAPPAVHPIDDLTGRFAIELRRRGYAASTISAQLRYSKQFLGASWIDGPGITHLQYDDICDYLASQFERHTAATSKIISSRLRVFLQFCWNAGVIELDLAQAVPMVKSHRLSSLPSFMSVAQLDQVLAACDRATVAGRRDFAILMLMSRLGRALRFAITNSDIVANGDLGSDGATTYGLNCDCPPWRLATTTRRFATARETALPWSSPTMASARSIPAVTPAEVIRSPSLT